MRLSHNGSASGRSAERRGRGRGGVGGGGRPRATRSADGGEAGERGGRGGGGGQARAGHGRGRGGGKWVEKWAKLQAAARITGRHFGREDPYFSQFFVVGASARHLAVEVLGFPVGHCQPSGPLHRSTPRHRRDHHHHPGRAASTIAPPLCRLAAIRCCGRPPISYSRPPPSSFPPLRPSLRLTLGPFHST